MNISGLRLTNRLLDFISPGSAVVVILQEGPEGHLLLLLLLFGS